MCDGDRHASGGISADAAGQQPFNCGTPDLFEDSGVCSIGNGVELARTARQQRISSHPEANMNRKVFSLTIRIFGAASRCG